MRLTKILLVLTSLVLLVSCTPAPGTLADDDMKTPAVGGELTGQHWVLTAMGDEGIVPDVMQAWIEFTADGQVTGNGGCNGFFGDYTASDEGTLEFGMIGMTEMWCEATGDLEVTFHEYLRSVKAYRVQDDVLSLFDENGAVLVFEPGEDMRGGPGTDAPIALGGALTDTRWNLTGMSDMELQYADLDIHITFAADNQATGNSGCNEFFGGYQYTDDGALSFDPLAMTRKYCEATDAFEQEFHTLLADVTSYAVAGNKLYLYNADHLDILRFEMDPDTPAGSLSLEQETDDLTGRTWIYDASSNDPDDTRFLWSRLSLAFTGEGEFNGYSGCNGYFGTYERGEERSLTLGPVGMTMMFCDDTAEQETAYLENLATVTHYTVEGDVLRLFNENDEVVLRFRQDPIDASATFTRDQLDNGTYPNAFADDGFVTLNHGAFSTPIADGAARLDVVMMNRMVFGDLNGDGNEQAVVIHVTSAGGTGTFYTLMVVDHDGDSLRTTDPFGLGDRVQIQDLRLEGTTIVINMVRHGPDDPLCCPTEEATVRFALENGELVELSE